MCLFLSKIRPKYQVLSYMDFSHKFVMSLSRYQLVTSYYLPGVAIFFVTTTKSGMVVLNTRDKSAGVVRVVEGPIHSFFAWQCQFQVPPV